MSTNNEPTWKDILFNPVPLIALMNTIGVFALIGAAMLGIDHGVLKRMADAEFARGLITYLFAVVTIGTAVVLVVYALTHAEAKSEDARFQKGKEVLSLLLGVFGTIVGFYFGSEIQRNDNEHQLQIAVPMLSSSTVASGGKITFTTNVSGGEGPYQYGYAFGDGDINYNEYVEDNGWITREITVPSVNSDTVYNFRIGVKDNSNTIYTKSTRVKITKGTTNPSSNNGDKNKNKSPPNPPK